MITIEVVYALPERQLITELSLAEGVNALQALEQSGLKAQFPDVDFASLGMGIFSRILDGRASPSPEDYVMRDGDRLELYRPLQVDPKNARLQRAAKKNRTTK